MREAEPFWPSFRKDLERYLVYRGRVGLWALVRLAFSVDGLWALAAYRLRRAGRARGKWPLRVVGAVLAFFVRVWSGIWLDADAEIAPGLYIGHYGSIYVGPGVRIGRFSSIGQMCHLSANLAGGAPTIGQRVYLGVGAKVIGPIEIGDDAAVGANAVVLEDVAPSAVVAGNPAVVISHKGSGDFIFLGESARQAG